MLPAGGDVLPAAGVQLQQLHVPSLVGGICSSGNMQDVDVERLGSSCPHLVELHLENVVECGADVSSLLSLQSCLRRLTVRGHGFGDAAAAVVAQLTNLQSLTWKLSSLLTGCRFAAADSTAAVADFGGCCLLQHCTADS